MTEYSTAVQTAQAYYNSDDAENFYARIWGGEDIHVGIYESADEPIRDASHRTVRRMAEQLDGQLKEARVIDLGGGYSGSARHLAREYGARVVSLNLSEVQNERARELNKEAGLSDLIEVVDGDFENVPYPDDAFDVVWSQDAFLHSGNRATVLAEIKRVLAPGGALLFTDPMQADDCPPNVLQPVLDRIQLDTMGSPAFYREQLGKLGLTKRNFEDLTPQLPTHYDRVLKELNDRSKELSAAISDTYVENMRRGLQHWVDAGNARHLSWGILHFENA